MIEFLKVIKSFLKVIQSFDITQSGLSPNLNFGVFENSSPSAKNHGFCVKLNRPLCWASLQGIIEVHQSSTGA